MKRKLKIIMINNSTNINEQSPLTSIHCTQKQNHMTCDVGNNSKQNHMTCDVGNNSYINS